MPQSRKSSQSAERTSLWRRNRLLLDNRLVLREYLLVIRGSNGVLVAAIVFIFLALLGYEYQKLPSPIALKDHYRALLTWYKQQGWPDTAAQKEFDEELDSHLASATDVNARNNRNRGNYIYRANLSVSIAVLFLALAGALYVNASLRQEDKIHKIRIVP